jgi:hypothetical protein
MFRNLVRAICLATAGLCLCAPARAGVFSITGSAGFGYQGPVLAASEQGGAYWMQPSMDGSQANVGYYLMKTGMFASSSLGNNSPAIPGSQLEEWIGSGGKADSSLTFSSPGGVRISLYATVAGYSNVNELGWYDVQDRSTLHPLFKGVSEDGSKVDSTTFYPTGSFGFYLRSPAGLFFSQDQFNPQGDLLSDGSDHQHFALFRDDSSGTTWFGVEDMMGPNPGEKGGDFNDLVFRVDPLGVVPEPSSLLLMGLASAAGVAVARRRQG